MKKFLSNLFLGKIAYKASANAPFEKVVEALEKSIKNNDFLALEIHHFGSPLSKTKNKKSYFVII